MKVLFIARGDLPDYQADTVMHGGRSVLGSDFVDANFAWYMYQKERKEFWNERVPNKGNSYGRGMTLHGSLPECDVDRTDIVSKIKNRYFDFVIYGSETRWLEHFDVVKENYPKNKIVFINGEDDQSIRERFSEMGILFKRELNGNFKDIHPISFGVPKEKIVKSVPTKTQDWATVIPGKPETYIFKDEVSYYADYQKSYFALTHKKGGWDCMRHYEILLNGCVPYFPDISECPSTTIVDFPKELCVMANKMVSTETINESQYQELAQKFLTHTKKKLTTETVFKKMLDIINA